MKVFDASSTIARASPVSASTARIRSAWWERIAGLRVVQGLDLRLELVLRRGLDEGDHALRGLLRAEDDDALRIGRPPDPAGVGVVGGAVLRERELLAALRAQVEVVVLEEGGPFAVGRPLGGGAARLDGRGLLGRGLAGAREDRPGSRLGVHPDELAVRATVREALPVGGPSRLDPRDRDLASERPGKGGGAVVVGLAALGEGEEGENDGHGRLLQGVRLSYALRLAVVHKITSRPGSRRRPGRGRGGACGRSVPGTTRRAGRRARSPG